jgi:hypothetical protein
MRWWLLLVVCFSASQCVSDQQLAWRDRCQAECFEQSPKMDAAVKQRFAIAPHALREENRPAFDVASDVWHRCQIDCLLKSD